MSRSMSRDGPGRRGFRWPAEWEPHRATWLSWPHNSETWPTSGLAPVEDAFCEMVRALVTAEAVEIHVEGPAMAERVRERLAGAGVEALDRVRFHNVATDDAWIRDHGGIFLLAADADVGADTDTDTDTDADTDASAASDAGAGRLLLDFEFDAWGGKYPPWDLDAAVGAAMAEAAGVPRFESAFVLEAGGLEGDGEGTILTTESCLMNPNRLRPGQDRSRATMESLLSELLGAKCVLWLGEGIEGDDTDGHIDDLARFIAPGRVVTIVEPDPADSNHVALAENRRRLEGFRDAKHRRLEIVELPTPGRIEGPGGRLPASYANFYIANQVVLAPVFGVGADREALAVLEACFPERTIVPIPSRALVEGLGAVHCLTQQEPAWPASDVRRGAP